MELTLNVEVATARSTISRLEVDGMPECFILEDTIREVPGVPVEEWKIKGETAIPAGRYKVVRTWSARFQRILPILVGVVGYSGIRIHPGNHAQDTEGCLLPGVGMGPDAVTHSREAFDALDHKITEAIEMDEEVWITIDRALQA